MATKTKAPVEPLKSQYSLLKNINQKLKYISDVYYIAFNNKIYMHSNVDFIEKIAMVKDDLNLSSYQGIMYLPNTLFEFTKNAKSTKLITNDLQNSIHLGQNDNDDIFIKLNRIYIPNNNISEEDSINLNIIPKMYTKFNNYFNNINELTFITLSEEIVYDITKNNIININDSVYNLIISRNLFTSIKKEDKLSYSIISSLDMNNKFYVIYKEESEDMYIFTLCAYLNM